MSIFGIVKSVVGGVGLAAQAFNTIFNEDESSDKYVYKNKTYNVTKTFGEVEWGIKDQNTIYAYNQSNDTDQGIAFSKTYAVKVEGDDEDEGKVTTVTEGVYKVLPPRYEWEEAGDYLKSFSNPNSLVTMGPNSLAKKSDSSMTVQSTDIPPEAYTILSIGFAGLLIGGAVKLANGVMVTARWSKKSVQIGIASLIRAESANVTVREGSDLESQNEKFSKKALAADNQNDDDEYEWFCTVDFPGMAVSSDGIDYISIDIKVPDESKDALFGDHIVGSLRS